MTSWRVKADVVHGVSVPTTFAGGCIPLTPVGIGIGIGEDRTIINLVLPQSVSVVLDKHPSSVFHLQTLEDQVHLDLCRIVRHAGF